VADGQLQHGQTDVTHVYTLATMSLDNMRFFRICVIFNDTKEYQRNKLLILKK